MWEQVIDELATIAGVVAICIVAIFVLKGQSTTIVAAGLGGLVGYLTKANRNGGNNAIGETVTPVPGPTGSGT